MNYCSPTHSRTFGTNIFDILPDELTFVKSSKGVQLANCPSVIDIEASSFYENGEKRATMYAWVFGLNGRCVRGRTWGELLAILDIISKKYNLSYKKRLIIYIHNFGYEFQWIRHYFKWNKVFSVDSRKPLYAITENGIEFRCSYLLSGYSLEKLGENLTKYKVQKMVGDLDYDLIRHSFTPLTEKEWGYILNDGLVVMAHIQEEIERLGSIAKIPLTKTGYVRNLCRDMCLKGDEKYEYSRLIRTLTLTPKTYLQCKRAFAGGFTHANANYVGDLIEEADSFDFTSSYPAIFLSEKFPMSPPHSKELKDEKEFLKYLKHYCCMFDIKFKNIRSKVSYENYISVSRCTNIEHYIVNNGRVIEATELEITLTEQDFFIISKLYKWDSIEISNFHYFYKAYLPRPLIQTVLQLYKDKTELKGIPEKLVEYMVSKGMINALYGMCVTEICKNEITYTNGEWGEEKADIEKLIDKYNKSNSRFLYYPWGVWITAYARRNLFTGIIEFNDDYIYSDTDSLKVLNAERHAEYISNYNKCVSKKVEQCLHYHDISTAEATPKTIKGIPKPIGVWDYEGRYTRFKTLGAKRYITEQNGEIEITVAGVNKKAGVAYLKHAFGDNLNIFNNFEENLYFPPEYEHEGEKRNGSGKLCHTYIDIETTGEVVDYMGNVSSYYEASSMHMENTDYTMSLTQDFINLLLGIKSSHIAV